jgi:Ca-activated chloride channel family protein
VEAEMAQVDAQVEAKLGELRKLAGEGGSKLLAAGEPVQVYVVEDESLNSVYKIGEDGYVALPKVGRVQVAGKDLPDAEKAIKEALEASPLARATVMVERADEKQLIAAAKKVTKEEDVPVKKPEPAPPGIPQPEVSTVENAFSTFSLNVSDVSFKLAAASLEKGLIPEVGSVRTEEFINAFNYHDPEPTSGSRIAFAWERARYPFAHDRDLVRFSVQTAAVGREPGKPLNIVLLLDNSGSMERADRLRIRQECLRVLASQLQPQDKVSVVSFARTARLWVDGLTGAQVKELPERVGNLTPEGGTNLEAAMDLAYQTVQKHFAPQGVNRVVLLTDGAANLGDVKPESLKKKVVSYRQQGVALDCFGIGWEGYNDDLLEALSRNGDGRYGFVNSPEAATTEFAAQLSGALKVAASDVKVQVEWNPKRVTVFRQLGYAKHQLKKEEFRDNTVDAAEIGAAEAGNALYTVQVNPAGEGPLGVVRVRYRLPGTDDYREQEWPLAYDGAAKDMQQASVPLRLAGTASAFSEWLVSSPYAGEVTPEKLIAQMAGVPEAYPADPRPKQLEWMIRQAKSLSGR